MEKSVTIVSSMSEKDYANFNISHTFSSPVFIVFLSIILVGNITTLIVGYINLAEFSVMIHVFPFAIILMMAMLPLWIRFNSKRAYQSSAFLKEEQTYTFDENGVTEKSKSGNAMLSWNEVFKVREDKTLVSVYISRVQAFIIPKKYMDSHQLKTLRSIIVLYLDSKQYHLLDK